MTEAEARKLSKKLRGRQSTDIAPTAKFSICCKQYPQLIWWPGMKSWTCGCDCMVQPITGDTLAVVIPKWNKRNEKAT